MNAFNYSSYALTLKAPTVYFLIRFILNNKHITTSLAAGSLLVDFIRYHENLKGTKIGCREGDCGACVVLVGELKDGQLHYQSVTSCLTPLANVDNRHVVTIEGVNIEGLNPVQQALTDEAATQCGFCTPGFVMSFTGLCLSGKKPTYENAIAAVDGNICRCTGYKSIERAAKKIAMLLESNKAADLQTFIAGNKMMPPYFTGLKEKLQILATETNGMKPMENTGRFIGGGTDLYVQEHDELKDTEHRFLLHHQPLKGVFRQGTQCVIAASATVTDLAESPFMQLLFPKLHAYFKLVSSTPIRNMATVAGNIINASPIGDLTIFLLALNATVVLTDGRKSREVLLRKLYRGYKSLDKQPAEYIDKIWFPLPDGNSFFHFEKVSKRSWLDIASVNTAIGIRLEDRYISSIHLSAGGVAPIPLYLEATAAFLEGKIPDEETILQAIAVMQAEIAPLSDVRGSAAYKRLLLAQLIKAHFITLFPELNNEKLIST